MEAAGVFGPKFDATVSGSGDLQVLGTATDLNATISGSGQLNLSGLDVQKAVVTITGSGEADIRVTTEALDATITGSGDIVYRGKPKIKQQILGSGTSR